MMNMALMLETFILILRTIRLILSQNIEKFLYVYRDCKQTHVGVDDLHS